MDRNEAAPPEKLPSAPPPNRHTETFRSDVKEKRRKIWRKDPDRLLQTHYSQFCNVIMIATFTGGIQTAILAFMNDLSARAGTSPLEVLDPVSPSKWHREYTVQSFGMMVGFLAVGLSMGCAGVAAINAALTCYYSVYPPTEPLAMEGHVLLCMILLFGAFGLSGISSILLSTKFDLPFTIAFCFVLFVAVVLAGYQILLQIMAKRISPFKKPWHLASVVLAAGILTVEFIQPTSSTWYTMLVCACAVGSCVVAILFVKGNREDPLYLSPWLHTFGATCMVLMWVGSTVIKLTWGLLDNTGRTIPFVLAALSALEVALSGVIAFFSWRYANRLRKIANRPSGQGAQTNPLS